MATISLSREIKLSAEDAKKLREAKPSTQFYAALETSAKTEREPSIWLKKVKQHLDH